MRGRRRPGPGGNHRRRSDARRRAQPAACAYEPAPRNARCSYSTRARAITRRSSRAAPVRPSWQRDWTDFVDARRFALRAGRDAVGADDRCRRGARRRAARRDRRLLRRRRRLRRAPHDVFLRPSDAHCGATSRWCGCFARDASTLDARSRGRRRARRFTSAGRSDGAIGELAGTLLHFSYPDYASYRVEVRSLHDARGAAMRSPVVPAMAGGTGRATLSVAAACESGRCSTVRAAGTSPIGRPCIRPSRCARRCGSVSR